MTWKVVRIVIGLAALFFLIKMALTWERSYTLYGAGLYLFLVVLVVMLIGPVVLGPKKS